VQFAELDAIEETASRIYYDQIRENINRARDLQISRFANNKLVFSKIIHSNSEMPGNLARKFVSLDKEGKTMLKDAVLKFNLSARGYYRVLKIARTIADLNNTDTVKNEYIAEALNFRLGLN
jgi:magnesium chelatase family protein